VTCVSRSGVNCAPARTPITRRRGLVVELRKKIDQAPMTRHQIIAIALCVVLNMVDGYDVLVMPFAAPGIARLRSLPGPEPGERTGVRPCRFRLRKPLEPELPPSCGDIRSRIVSECQNQSVTRAR